MMSMSVDITDAHHDDCVGADTEFHNLIRLFPQGKIIGPDFPESDAQRANNKCDEVRPVPKSGPLKRNRNIVDEVDLMLATPLPDNEILRSGTWSTIRYAGRPNVNHPLVMIWRDGTIENRGEFHPAAPTRTKSSANLIGQSCANHMCDPIGDRSVVDIPPACPLKPHSS